MANNTSTECEERLEQPEDINNQAEPELDGDAIAAATAQMFKGLMGQIQYAAMAVANGETSVLRSSPPARREVLDMRNIHRDLPGWINRAYDSPDAARELTGNKELIEWLERKSCKRKEYFDDFNILQQLTEFYAELGRYDLGIKAAEKALAITNLHRQGDPDVLSDLNWSLAQLNAANQDMERAERWLAKCVLMVEPGADHESEIYRGLLAQLQETFDNARRRLAG